jgi:tRNA modification GTPase
VIDSLRQKKLLEECASSLMAFRKGLADDLPLDLLAVDLKGAMDSLGEITGAITTDDMLQRMFSQFCVGK